VLLHHVRATVLGGDLTSIAWNHALHNQFMFATGSHDGAVRIWTTRETDEAAAIRRNLSRTDTATLFDMEPEYPRTASPVNQLELDSLHGHSASSSQSEPPAVRSVAFATPEPSRNHPNATA